MRQPSLAFVRSIAATAGCYFDRVLKGVVVEVLKDYVLGDTIARYMQPGLGGPVGMMLFPAAMAGQVAE